MVSTGRSCLCPPHPHTCQRGGCSSQTLSPNLALDQNENLVSSHRVVCSVAIFKKNFKRLKRASVLFTLLYLVLKRNCRGRMTMLPSVRVMRFALCVCVDVHTTHTHSPTHTHIHPHTHIFIYTPSHIYSPSHIHPHTPTHMWSAYPVHDQCDWHTREAERACACIHVRPS